MIRKAHRIAVVGLGLLVSHNVNAAGPSWAPAETRMVEARFNHVAAPLPSGEVLLAGGVRGGSPLASAELYKVGGGFRATAPMGTARNAATATVLRSGKVLVVGGLDAASRPLASAEVYSAPTGRWSAAPLARCAHGAYHTATLLPSGAVLVAGGSGAATCVELFDPAAGTAGAWTQLASLGTGRSAHVAFLTPNGAEVVVAGGRAATGSGYTDAIEVYVIAENRWFRPYLDTHYSVLARARGWLTATPMPPGVPAGVVIAGGYDATVAGATGTTESYFAGPRSATQVGSLGIPRYAFPAALLPSGKVLASGGMGGGNPYLASAEIFDPAQLRWSRTADLGARRANHSATVLASGKVLVAGGVAQGDGIALDSAELFYDPVVTPWMDWRSDLGYVPANAIPAGWVIGSGTCYACSALHFGAGSWNTHPGKLCASEGRWSCFIGNGGREERYEQYKVLVGDAASFTWVAMTSASAPPAGATWGGWVVDSGDCYVCSAWHYGGGSWNRHPGKLCRSLDRWSCFIGNGGVEQRYESFNVLTTR